MREKKALKITGFIISISLLIIGVFGTAWRSVTAESSTEHIISNQSEFEALLEQAYRDSAVQISQKEKGEALTAGAMGTNAEIILNCDVKIPDSWSEDEERSMIDALYLPYDVKSLTIRGNGNTIEGRVSNSYGYGSSSLSQVMLEDVVIESARTALTLNVNSACSMDVEGDVKLISAKEIGLELRGDGRSSGGTGSVSLNLGSEDTLFIKGDHYGIYDLLNLDITVDGGLLELNAAKDAAL